MTISYQRAGGMMGRPPPDKESLQIDDATFTMWRWVGAATYPPTPIGRFAGTLELEMAEILAKESAAAMQAGDLRLMLKPDAVLETISADGVQASLGANDDPGGPWQQLIEQLRQLLGDLTAQPRAAIAARVRQDGAGAQLVRLGDEPLRLDFTKLTVRAVLWQDYKVLGDWGAPNAGVDGQTTAEPEWSMDLPFDHGFEVPEGASVRAYVTFSVFNGDHPVPVSVEAS